MSQKIWCFYSIILFQKSCRFHIRLSVWDWAECNKVVMYVHEYINFVESSTTTFCCRKLRSGWLQRYSEQQNNNNWRVNSFSWLCVHVNVPKLDRGLLVREQVVICNYFCDMNDINKTYINFLRWWWWCPYRNIPV